ncbi:N-acyl amino acid synthase FeeM domain-containing protein [Algibacillus agarilyticus]|uniref:N-acyl amino acid synthase FeeM domain-containing protein n=1 Tax=Algibacillus agarilyticus TaxID=2234133 RepID=UPI000DD0170D|nr:cyclic nucleotide-binding domain-containing protein [Algibacillus agarilyticus]
MSIRIKVATTAKELNDVYRLRKSVYVDGEGLFKELKNECIVDQYDSLPKVANIIAYDEGSQTAIGTVRINLDSEIGLLSDDLFDFNAYREQIQKQRQLEELPPPAFIGVGMLAIAKPWRNRRDVFFALFKMGCNVAHSWGATHVIATVNAKTISIYKRLGFNIFSDEIYVPDIGESVLPIGHDFAPVYQWVSGAFGDSHELLDCFADCFEYLLIDRGNVIFNENDQGDEAFLINKGRVEITKSINNNENTLSLATLNRGALLGELSLIDHEPRSASAVTLTNCEFIVLNHDIFWQKVTDEPRYLRGLLNMLCSRLRQVDDLAFVLSHGTEDVRLNFFINKLRDNAKACSGDSNECTIKVNIDEIASMAKVSVSTTIEYLNRLQTRNILIFMDKHIKFIGQGEI